MYGTAAFRRGGQRMKKCLLLLVICGMLAGCSSKTPDIVIGSKDFTEQYILGYMLMHLIDANTSLTVAYNKDLSSGVIFSSIRAGGVIDLYVDYTGTVYGSYLRRSDAKNAQEVYDISARELYERFSLQMLDPLGFNNTFSLAVRADTAETYGLRTFSDLARVSSGFIFAGSAEILTRSDGLPNLKRLYQMSFKEERIRHGVDRYHAIDNDEIQVTEVFTTDGSLLKHDLVVLEDDMNFFPPYQGVVIIRNETLDKHPVLRDVLGRLAGLLTDEVMRGLNYRVDVLDETPEAVAINFLRLNHLI
jgi:osmoprotectant transport system permease protein